MMSVSAHDRISGTPQMVKAWDAFLTYAWKRPGVAFLRKDAIARYVLQSPLTLRESERPSNPKSATTETSASMHGTAQ
jgi:hypothetical protein